MSRLVRQKFSHGKKTIGASAVQLSTDTTALDHGVRLKAATANTGNLFIGNSNAVTAGTADATDGFFLDADQEVFLQVTKLADIWIIASAAAQIVYFTGV